MSFNKRILSAGAASLVPSENFGISLYTGGGSGNNIDINTLGFQADLVWTKSRSTTYSNPRRT